MAVFGSASYKELDEVSDIDILLFVNPSEFESVREYVSSLNFNTITHVETMLCSYTKLPETKKPQGDRRDTPIHFAFLPRTESDYTQTSLWNQNKHNIKFIC